MDNGGAFTDRLLDDAQIRSGQLALDVGCGSGDISFRLAERVGSAGRVIGIDLNNDALERAEAQALERGITNVSFLQANLHTLPESIRQPHFDVVTCRRVLMYLPDKVAALRCLFESLKPGGRLVLQEHDASVSISSASLPETENAHRLIWDTVRAEGADTKVGLKLHDLIIAAGGKRPSIRAEAVVQTPDQASPTQMILQAMRERIVAAGVASDEEMESLDIATLDERLKQERKDEQASYVGEMIFGVIAERPQ